MSKLPSLLTLLLSTAAAATCGVDPRDAGPPRATRPDASLTMPDATAPDTRDDAGSAPLDAGPPADA
ncbi:hypothetical protein L6R52_32365, partial [Myxococcota bacterium]|nr:hypothetical protein [Myxococcota bacterium]